MITICPLDFVYAKIPWNPCSVLYKSLIINTPKIYYTYSRRTQPYLDLELFTGLMFLCTSKLEFYRVAGVRH